MTDAAATETAEPISPYIYGQFIEHLGRCIYGGIWAEMLEDRKFYFPGPADGDIWRLTRAEARVLAASPWKVIGTQRDVAALPMPPPMHSLSATQLSQDRRLPIAVPVQLRVAGLRELPPQADSSSTVQATHNPSSHTFLPEM